MCLSLRSGLTNTCCRSSCTRCPARPTPSSKSSSRIASTNCRRTTTSRGSATYTRMLASKVCPGRAVQVDPIKPTLKAPGRLELKCDEPLSNFAFNFNPRRYIPDGGQGPRVPLLSAPRQFLLHIPRKRPASRHGRGVIENKHSNRDRA